MIRFEVEAKLETGEKVFAEWLFEDVDRVDTKRLLPAIQKLFKEYKEKHNIKEYKIIDVFNKKIIWESENESNTISEKTINS